MLVIYNPEKRKPKRVSPLILNGVSLHPGNNELTVAEWEKANSQPAHKQAIDDLIKQQIIEVRDETIGQDHTELTGYNQSEAIALIEQTYDLTLLKQWDSAEKRRGVSKALATQIDKITTPKAKK